jgi:hypothetical protein
VAIPQSAGPFVSAKSGDILAAWVLFQQNPIIRISAKYFFVSTMK